MNYRMRAIDSSGTIGDWQTGNFHLPNHDISLSNGLATFTVNYSSLQLMENSIEDAYVDSVGGLSNINYGSDGNITVGSHSSSQQYGLMRLNLITLVCTKTHQFNLRLYHLKETQIWTEPMFHSTSWKIRIGLNQV